MCGREAATLYPGVIYSPREELEAKAPGAGFKLGVFCSVLNNLGKPKTVNFVCFSLILRVCSSTY